MTARQVEICGNKIGVTIRFENDKNEGVTEIIVVDWIANKAKRVGVHS